ncbi:MAG TPA: DNA internalization-related competence protein ComEC/Rec2 [Gammaproteobacteria bacterium]|nr:DNA internalization-related competence protein ComEC/Rec2 [Gammaproteobacteria bacterium]
MPGAVILQKEVIAESKRDVALNLPAAALAFLFGVMLLDYLPVLPPVRWLALLAPLLLAWRWPLGRYLVIIALGFAWAWFPAHEALQHRLPSGLEGVDLNVTGVVQPFPKREGRLVRMTLRVTHFDSATPLVKPPRNIRLNWYWPDAMPRPGETWRFRVRLKRPNGFQNPGGFDYEGWLFRNGIDATGYVRHGRAKRIDADGGGLLLHLRRSFAAVIDHAVPGSPYAGILKGVTIGDGHDIPGAQWDLFRRTGITHLVVISGSHIVLVAGFVGWLIGFFWRRSLRLCERLAARRAAVTGGLLVAIAYSLIAGFGIPVQRALIMFVVAAVALWRGRETRPLSVLAVALIGVLLIDPLAPASPGFWLSFGAVAVLIYVFAGRPRRGWLRTMLWAQVAVSISLLPFLTLFFGQASVVGPFANLIAIPVFELAVVPLALVGVVAGAIWLPAGQFFLGGAALCLKGLWPVLTWFAALPQAQVHLPTPSIWLALLAVSGVILLLAPRGIPARWLGAVMIAPLLLAPRAIPPEGGFDLTLLDVGQGLSAVVRTHAHTLIFDTGPDFGSGSDTGDLVVVPYLRSLDITDPDMLLISHGDSDQAGGAQSVLAAFPQLPVVTSAGSQFPGSTACVAGEHWRWDGVAFAILNPPNADGLESDNNRSCVLKISAAGGSALLTGDIEVEAEQRLVAEDRAELRSDILVAPHHGSASSSSRPFVRAVDPDFVLFPVGYRNQWDFPRAVVKMRYRAVGADLLNTAACGAIHLRVAKKVKLVAAWRPDHRRLWTRAGETSCE